MSDSKGAGNSKPTGYDLAGWDWKPYTQGSASGGSARYHIFTKSGETYYQCLYRRGGFHPLLDDRSYEIPESEVTQILDISESRPNAAPLSDSKGAAIDEQVLQLIIVTLLRHDTLENIQADAQELKQAILAILAQEVNKTQTNAVAWAVGVIDLMHEHDRIEGGNDRIYKGLKNTIRDRYKAETGVDPAPNYPIKAGLV